MRARLKSVHRCLWIEEFDGQEGEFDQRRPTIDIDETNDATNDLYGRGIVSVLAPKLLT